MKSLLYSLSLLFGILLVSCSTDENNKSLDEKILEGSWYFQRHGEVCSNGNDLSEGLPYEFKFLSNKTLEFTDPGYLTSSSYDLNGNELTVETIYTLPSGDFRKFIGIYEYSETNETFTGSSTFSAYNESGTLWTCTGTCSVYR